MLEDLIKNNYFLYDYKEHTLSLINQIIENRNEYTYNEVMKVVDNFNNQYYNNIKNSLIDKDQEIILKDFYFNKISSDKGYIDSLKDMKDFLTKCYPIIAGKDLLNVSECIEKLEKGKINVKEKYKEQINELINKYSNNINKYKNIHILIYFFILFMSKKIKITKNLKNRSLKMLR